MAGPERRRAVQRALSLVEVLIFIGLSGIILSLLSQVMIPGFQIWKHTQAVSEMEQNAMLAETRLESALLQTVPDSITTVDKPDLQAVSFLDTEGSMDQAGYDPLTGEPLWRAMLVFELRPDTGVLRQIRWDAPPLPTKTAFAFTGPELENVCDTRDGRLVASKVKSLRVEPEPDEAFWNVEIAFETNTPTGLRTVQRGFAVVPRIYP